ncbi:MAG: S9 family peptidase [Acidimicrobiia bacterium]|nr:S9 family peptidase [Acidimicrobiia bacterium]
MPSQHPRGAVAPTIAITCALAWTLVCGLVTVTLAQQRPLTIDDLYDPTRRVNFAGAPIPPVSWIDGRRYAMARQTADGPEWQAVDAATGTAMSLLTAERLERALTAAGVAGDAARQASRARTLTFDGRFASTLHTIGGDLYVYTLATDRAVRLTTTTGPEEFASFSPDGRRVAYVRQGNLFVSDVTTPREIALTADGSDKVLNGRLDWVYEEEIFGRGQPRAYWWSPDSALLAYLRIDDTHVPVFTVVDHIPYDQGVERWYYPKVGDPNPTATLGVVSASGGATRWVNLGKYPEADRIINAVAWAPNGREVVFQAQNRSQTWLDLNVADAATGVTRTLFRETSRAWVSDTTDPAWLADGSFLWLSERSGYRHIYLCGADGRVRREITTGPWEVRALYGVDESAGWVYFAGTERSPIGVDVYRVRLTGAANQSLQRLTQAAGTHSATFSPRFEYFTNTWSDATTPPQLRLHDSDGSEVRVLEPNRVAALDEFVRPRPEFLQVKARDGFLMEAMLIKPSDFDPSRRYPVYTFVYGGPHAQRVRNAWASETLFLQLLAEQGIVIWSVDNRTASGKGAQSTWPVYRNFGEWELRDLEDSLTWLKTQSYTDPARIGIHGWSYGGYLTAYALTHSQSFAMGIAGGTVSDWRNYDSMYTERYMGPLSENEEGYTKSSPRFAAAHLHGSLLLIHGLIDDNVHVDNTIQLAHELQKAQKPFELMLYPKSRHGITDPALVKHMRSLMLDFVLRTLKPERVSRPARETAGAGAVAPRQPQGRR